MKFRITEGVNSFDGTPMFYVYEVFADGGTSYRFGAGNEDACHQYVERQYTQPPERVIAEIDGPTL
jgi:hypothetical protein